MELIWEKNLEKGGQKQNRWKKPGKKLNNDEKNYGKKVMFKIHK